MPAKCQRTSCTLLLFQLDYFSYFCCSLIIWSLFFLFVLITRQVNTVNCGANSLYQNAFFSPDLWIYGYIDKASFKTYQFEDRARATWCALHIITALKFCWEIWFPYRKTASAVAEKTGKQVYLFVPIAWEFVLIIVYNFDIQANVLEELLLFPGSREYGMSETLRIVLSKIRDTEARANLRVSYLFLLVK